jgi:hypothetical protein
MNMELQQFNILLWHFKLSNFGRKSVLLYLCDYQNGF